MAVPHKYMINGVAHHTGDTITFEIGEHVYVTPPIPPHEEIVFHNLKKEDQYWRRQTDFPKEFFDWHDDPTGVGQGVELDAKKTEYLGGKLVSIDKETSSLIFDQVDREGREGLLAREIRRRTKGCWVMINGIPTYFTGDFYGMLQWLPMLGCDNTIEPGSPYGQFYKFQLLIAYLWELGFVVDYARGFIVVKPKKTGLTQEISLLALNRGMTQREKNIRMMSITEDIAKKSLFKFMRTAMEKVPPILMPSRSKQNEGEVIFGNPDGSKNQLRKRKVVGVSEYLNTWITTVPTTRAGFDSFTNYLAITDEFPKIKDSTYPAELLEATLPTVIEGFRRKGQIFWLSYVPEKSDRSFRESRQIYKDSKLKTRKVNPETGEMYGDTKSKMLCYTLTVQQGMFNCCDKYGEPIPEKVWKEINKEIDDCNGDSLRIQAVRRQYPTSEADPWRETGREETPFDNLRLSQKAEELEEMLSVGDLPYMDFNLHFEKTPEPIKGSPLYRFDGKILMKPVTREHKNAGAPEGRFKWFRPEWTPQWFLEKHLNRVKKDQKTGLLMPDRDSPFFISIDPPKYRISKNTGKSSQNAIQVFVLPDAQVNAQIGKNVTNRRLICSSLSRPNNPKEILNDIIACILLFGCVVQIESNVSTWATKLIEMGLGNFVLMVNEDGALEPYNEHRKQKYFTSTKDQIDQYFDAGAEFLGEPMAPGEIDNIQYIDDIDVLTQLQDIRKDNTTEYDAAVAFLEGQMGINAWLGWKRGQVKQQNVPSEMMRQFAANMLS